MSKQDDKLLDVIQGQYLVMVPIQQLLGRVESCFEDLSLDAQGMILQKTLQSEIGAAFPPSLSYRKCFLKKLLDKFETTGQEVCDEFYEEYSSLMSLTDNDEVCYKTYLLPGCNITLKESKKLVSAGTTGLRTWQASLNLVEWAFKKKHFFEGKHVLELGSGLGFAGIAIVKLCRPKTYCFSDCHDDVLHTLAQNIELNFREGCVKCHGEAGSDNVDKERMDNLSQVSVQSNPVPRKLLCDNSDLLSESETLCSSIICDQHWNQKTFSDSCTLPARLKSEGSVQLCKIDWEEFSEECLQVFGDVETVIAADVVYDPSIIPALVRVLSTLLHRCLPNGVRPVAYIASTIRNTETRDIFLSYLDAAGIEWKDTQLSEDKFLFHDDSVPVQILTLRKGQEKGSRTSVCVS